MVTSPSLQDEVSFITGVKANGTLTQYSYWGWNRDNPATYNSTWTRAAKFGGNTAGSAGGTVAYYFDPNSNWSATEKANLASGLALWAAVANISFVQTTTASQAKISFTRGKDSGAYTYTNYSAANGACMTGGSTLGTINTAPISIDTSNACFSISGGFSSYGGYGMETMLHEQGHALGLGHAGAYNGAVNNATQQYSAYDTRQWSIMSYIDGGASAKYSSQNPVQGTAWSGHYPTTWMPLDILAIQQLYGVAVNTPLSGGQTFGFHCNIDPSIKQYFDFTVNTKPVITIWDKGTNNTLDLSGFTTTANINLNAGTFSSCAGMTNNIAIAYDTAVDTLVCGSGATSVICNNNGDTIWGGNGNDSITGGSGNDIFYGGAGNDTVKYAGAFSAYNLVVNADGTITISGNGAGSDTLSGIETLVFSDKTVATSTLTSPPVTTPPPSDPTQPSNPPTTSQPLAQRDFDGNGKADILLAISANNSVQVWTMNGTTRVAATTISAPNANYTSALTGDFNGDGKSDILWQNGVTNALTEWTMSGTSKTASTTLNTPDAGWTATGTGDLDGDGKSDIILQKDGQVQAWFMNGTSVKQASTVTGAAAPVSSRIAAINDFNGDGKDDILWQNASTGALELWTMNGTSVASDTVLSDNSGASWRVVTAADFNGDGKADILLQDDTSGQTKIAMMNGATILSGSGLLGNNLGTAWKAVGAGDYNGDGTADILFRNSSNGQYQAFFMNGTSIVSSGTLSVNPGTSWHAVSDTNTVVTPATTTAPSAPSSSEPVAPQPSPAAPLAQRDFNGDGKGDILLNVSDRNRVQVWTMDGTNRVSATTLGAPNSNYTTALTGDFDGDGKTDILWQNGVTNALTEWKMNGTSIASSTTLTTPSTGWKATAVGDVDGNGKADIILQNGGQVQIWQMNGSSVTSASGVIRTQAAGATIIAANDFNGDGKADILWQNTTTGALEIWQMNGTTVANDTVLSNNPGAKWRAVTTGDFNRDGKADILLQDSTSGQMQILFMDGDKVLSGSGTIATNPGSAWKACGSADYNGDGFADVLLRNSSTGAYMAMTMSGTSVLASTALSVNPGTGWNAVAG